MTSTKKRKMPKQKPKRATKRPLARKAPNLKSRMAGIRKELNGLRAQNGSDDLFRSTLDQLDALSDEIAEAADGVMTACEDIQDTADAIAAKTKERGTKTKLKTMTGKISDIFEACSFQDLTGQRIGKISRSVTALEETTLAVSALAGGKDIAKGRKNGHGKPIDRVDAGIVLEGPQINGPAVSQADIDSLFD